MLSHVLTVGATVRNQSLRSFSNFYSYQVDVVPHLLTVENSYISEYYHTPCGE